MKLSDKEIFIGLKENNHVVLKYCYAYYFKSVKRHVLRYNGCLADAKDVFQDALELFYMLPEMNFKTSFSLQFNTVCKNLWQKRNRKMKNIVIDSNISNDCQMLEDTEVENDLLALNELKFTIFSWHFERLDSKCQQLLKMCSDKVPHEIISNEIGISISYIKRRKSMCKERLIENIRNDVRNKNPETKTPIL
jgi:DNA-directed RNA polymerase specialized sigma24 family protein